MWSWAQAGRPSEPRQAGFTFSTAVTTRHHLFFQWHILWTSSWRQQSRQTFAATEVESRSTFRSSQPSSGRSCQSRLPAVGAPTQNRRTDTTHHHAVGPVVFRHNAWFWCEWTITPVRRGDGESLSAVMPDSSPRGQNAVSELTVAPLWTSHYGPIILL